MSIVHRLVLFYCGCFLSNISLVHGQRVAEKKCQEYIEQNTQYSTGGTLSLNPILWTDRHRNCSTSVDLIINGVEAGIDEFPHQALLGKPKENCSVGVGYYCGGSLISERFVLTAAHCCRPTVVRLGAHDLTDIDDDGVDYEVSNFIRHPRYSIKRSYFDIALVELSKEVKLLSAIRPACLWTTDPFNLSTVVATGFGATENGTNSPVLMKVRLNVMDKAKCEEKFLGYRKHQDGVKDEQMCVGSQKGGKDTCSGDSGGPIQVATDLETCAYYVVGITSAGGACGVGTSESLYTKVASYVDWIEEIVWHREWLESQSVITESTESYQNKIAVQRYSIKSPNSGRIFFPGDY